MLEGNWQEKISISEYERAFTEFASFLHELYRKQKLFEQQNVPTKYPEEDYDVKQEKTQ